jgi:hypothetical protein
VGYSDRAVTISQLGVGLAHRFSSQWQAVRVVQKAVEDGVGEGGFTDEIVPVLDEPPRESWRLVGLSQAAMAS